MLGQCKSGRDVPPAQQIWGQCILPPLLQHNAGVFPSSLPGGEPLGERHCRNVAGGLGCGWHGYSWFPSHLLGGCATSRPTLPAGGRDTPGAELNVSELLSLCAAAELAREVRDGQDMHQQHARCRMKHPALPRSFLPSPWIFQVGRVLRLVLSPAPALAGGAKLGAEAQSNAEDIKLGVLGPRAGCVHPKCAGGRWRGQPVTKERGGASRPRSRAAGRISATCGMGMSTQTEDIAPCSRTVCPGVQAPGRGRRDRVWMPPTCAAAGKGAAAGLGP